VNRNFPELLAGFQMRESCANQMERVARRDLRNDTSLGAPSKQSCKFIWIAEGRPENLQLPDEDASQVGRRLIADGCAAGDNSAAADEALKGSIPDRAADVFYHHVDPASFCQSHDLWRD